MAKSNVRKYERIESLIEKGMSVKNACGKVGLSQPAFYAWRKKNQGETKVIVHESKTKPKRKRKVVKNTTQPGKVAVLVGSPESVVPMLIQLGVLGNEQGR